MKDRRSGDQSCLTLSLRTHRTARHGSDPFAFVRDNHTVGSHQGIPNQVLDMFPLTSYYFSSRFGFATIGTFRLHSDSIRLVRDAGGRIRMYWGGGGRFGRGGASTAGLSTTTEVVVVVVVVEAIDSIKNDMKTKGGR